MRKFISILSAAALASSMIVPLAAHAEGETVLYSDSLNGYETSQRINGGKVFAVVSTGEYGSVEGNPDWTWIFDSPETQVLDKLTFGFDGGRGDDTGAIMIKEKEEATDKYVSLPQNRFSSRCKPQISGFDGYTAKDGEDLVIAFDLKLTPGLEGSVANPVLVVDGIGNITTAEAGNDWVKVKAVTSDGSTSLYVGDTAVVENVSGSISVIKPQPFDTDTRISGNYIDYATVDIDNIVILSAADGMNAEIPEAETHTQEVVDPGEATPMPEAAAIDKTTTIDFDTTDFEAAGVTMATNASGVEQVEDAAIAESKVLKAAFASAKTDKYEYATIDFSSLTRGKAHVILSYDLYAGADGRIRSIVQDGMLTESNSDNLGGMFNQGITKSNSATAVVANEWVHTVVDLDIEHKLGSYVVTNSAGDEISKGNIAADKLTGVTTLSLASWSPNTSYLDNIVIQTGGEIEVIEPVGATPEPAGTAAGSGVDLLPEGATKFADFAEAEGEAEIVLNHENAKPAVNDKSVSIYDANANIRGKSVYAAYDVYVDAGDKLVMKAMNKTDLGTQFVLEGKDDGTVDVYAFVDKGDKVNIKGNLVCKTWYRAVIEIPQNNNNGATNTGDARFTIYRIDKKDSAKTAGIAAQASGLTPRNLSSKAATNLVTEVTGTPYIDNGVTYLMTRSDNIWYRYHFKSVDGVKTVTSIEEIPADDLAKKADKLGKEYYIWNTYMTPYVKPATEPTPEVTE